MEHRVGQRSYCRLPVTLRNRRTGEVRGEILDISAGGALIKVADDAAIPQGLVKIEFQTPPPEQTPCEWSALVVRKTSDTIGVMFDRRHKETVAWRMQSRTKSYTQALNM